MKMKLLDNIVQKVLQYGNQSQAPANDTVVLVIDVQKQFCDPKTRGNKRTEKASERISAIIPAFREAGLPVYAVYFSTERLKAHQIDFYKFKPDRQDILVAKNSESACRGSNIHEILKKNNIKTILACGFNINAC